jgi:hypothetical protein
MAPQEHYPAVRLLGLQNSEKYSFPVKDGCGYAQKEQDAGGELDGLVNDRGFEVWLEL